MQKKTVHNILSHIPKNIQDEFIETLTKKKNVRVERIVSRGHCSPRNFWYDQDTDEFVIVLNGEAKIQFKDEKDIVYMKKGDYLIIPAHRKHRVQWTSPERDTIWLALHY
jgi:cupin 2 domain-containing protein